MALTDFLNYYKNCLKMTDSDFENFTKCLEYGLPSTFRITPTESKLQLIELFSKYNFISKVPYLNDVYTFNLRSKTEEYKNFMNVLVPQTIIGNIQRQEVVSMLPHLFMDLKSHHKVLETCASPGSKTKNMLEIIKDGILISNDKSSSRVNILISESAKKATKSFIITQQDATRFPNLSFKFDRICCDVPCTSDGTFRKTPTILPRWTINDSIAISAVQLNILKRAIDLLDNDGILVYSTCSLNPIENEWVISNILSRDDIELQSNFPNVQYFGEEECIPEKITVRRGITTFKHGKFEFDNEDLSKCMRIMPHDQNTGGFFIAVIKKKSMDGNSVRSKEVSGIEKTNKTFVEIDEDIISKINKDYDMSKLNDKFVSFNYNFKNLFSVTPECLKILKENPRLKIVYAGIKAFVESDLRKGSYRAKSYYMTQSKISTHFNITLNDFRLLLCSKEVPSEKLSFKPTGPFRVQVIDTEYRFSGFGFANKAFLYIDDNSRQALKQLYNE